MATIALAFAGQALGASLGGTLFGASTAVAGRFAGAFVGNFIDNLLFAPKLEDQEGARYSETSFTTATEGIAIPRGIGFFRCSGNLIWSSRFKETATTEQVGGKGSNTATSTTYSYTASFAIGLCEGEIGDVLRIWADGKELDQNEYTIRVYKGDETQLADSLISSIETYAPAYRGLAYVVFEDFSLNSFGNRIPQFEFEVSKPVESTNSDVLKNLVTGVALLPGSGEFTCDPEIVSDVSEDSTTYVNRSTLLGGSDWEEGINQLETSLPNCDTVLLVSTWFADDLRMSDCEIRPKSENATKNTDTVWKVDVYGRSGVEQVSQIDGSPAFGGTFNDQSLIDAIDDLHTRGFKVIFYPFIQCDIESTNTLPNPYSDNASSTGQDAYPWRGRITCSPAIGYAGTVDKTATATSQVESFYGDALASEWTYSSGIQFTGSAQWSYSRFILHHAYLASRAEFDIEYFCIGSEMVQATSVRDNNNNFPFVDKLVDLVAEVNVLLPNTDIGYSANWDEYHSYRPSDGSNDVYFNLDKLWAVADFVGIDYYIPLSDWREGNTHTDYSATNNSIYNLDYLKANIEGGEYYDWYYINTTDRLNQIRTTISDGVYSKDWIYRQKDLRNWWKNQHFNLPGGLEDSLAGSFSNDIPSMISIGTPIRTNVSNTFGPYNNAQKVASSGSSGNRIRTTSITDGIVSGETYLVQTFIQRDPDGTNTNDRVYFRLAGTGNDVQIRDNGSGLEDVGTLAPDSFGEEDMGNGVSRVWFIFTATVTDTSLNFQIGPSSNVSGDSIIVYGMSFNKTSNTSTASTDWVKESKPIIFTEFGCPAVDKGSNQPNVFYDEKSSESSFPYFSLGSRDDMIQRQYIKAVIEYWTDDSDNIVEIENSCIWAYDSRPWPSFPFDNSVWGDADNFYLGHWISGRVSSVYIPELLQELSEMYSVNYTGDFEESFGNCYGIYIPERTSFRAIVEPLTQVYSFGIIESGDEFKAFSRRSGDSVVTLDSDSILQVSDSPDINLTKLQESDLPYSLTMSYGDITKSYNQGSSQQRRQIVDSDVESSYNANIILDSGIGQALVDSKLYDTWARRDTINLSCLPEFRYLEPGDIVTLNSDGFTDSYRITSIEDTLAYKIEAESFDLNVFSGSTSSDNRNSFTTSLKAISGTLLEFMDLPLIDGNTNNWQPLLAAYSDPFVNSNVYDSVVTSNYTINTVVGTRADLGVTTATLNSNNPNIIDKANTLSINLYSGSVSSVTDEEFLSGVNSIAVETSLGNWEIIFFKDVVFNGSGQYDLTNLIRGYYGTEDNIISSLASGARVVVLNSALSRLEFSVDDVGLSYYYRYGPSTKDIGDISYTTEQLTFDGRGLRPYSVAHVTWEENSGDYDISWIRRARYGDFWEEGDVPLGENGESYEVDILSGSSVVRTLTSSVQSITYTSSDRISDGVSIPFNIKIYQMSDDVGRGIVKEATIG